MKGVFQPPENKHKTKINHQSEWQNVRQSASKIYIPHGWDSNKFAGKLTEK